MFFLIWIITIVNWSKKHLRYKKLITKENWFENIVGSIQDTLSADQLRRIKLLDKNETYDLWEQIFLWCIDNRYWLPTHRTEILEKVDSFLEKYTFLLNSNLDNTEVRHIYMKALMNFISAGSGLFFSLGDCLFLKFGHGLYRSSWRERKKTLFRLWEIFRKDFTGVCQLIDNKYPSIPKTQFCLLDVKGNKHENWKFCSLNEMMSVSYGYAFWRLLKAKKINLEEFKEELLKRTKWYLESLTQCSSIFINKYKERVFQELSISLGMDIDRSYFVYLSFLKEPEGNKYKEKNDLSEFIAGLFSKEELKLFELKDVQGNVWSFQEQIKDRYYSKYPSFVSMKEIKENIRKKVSKYQPLLNESTVEVIRDFTLDEIERECFVCRNTYLWNQEMEKNLKERNFECSKQIAKAIDLLISILPPNAIEQLQIKIDDKAFSLKEQFICRWNQSWFGSSLKDFQEYLSQMHIYTPYSFEYWKGKETISRTDLQTFLEEIDMFFLYPHKWRIIKKLMSRLDNGRIIGNANIKRVKMAQSREPFAKLWFKRNVVVVSLFLAFIFFCYFYSRFT